MERWLVEVETMMVQSLQDVTVRAVESHASLPHSTWLQKWPSQVVLTVANIVWTAEVQLAIKNDTLLVFILFFFCNLGSRHTAVALDYSLKMASLGRSKGWSKLLQVSFVILFPQDGTPHCTSLRVLRCNPGNFAPPNTNLL